METKKHHPPETFRAVPFAALLCAIPAFYLLLSGASDSLRNLGSGLYAVTAALLAIDLYGRARKSRHSPHHRRSLVFDGVILAGAVISIRHTALPWSTTEWVLRLLFCGLVFIRLTMMSARWIAPHRLMQVFLITAVLLALAGGGFYWLEPKVQTYADGLWLAFITGATVGYGDLVPSTAASRILAFFIVLLGYALFSIATASIAALFVGEDEKRFQHELHHDVRALRAEIESLRKELQHPIAKQ